MLLYNLSGNEESPKRNLMKYWHRRTGIFTRTFILSSLLSLIIIIIFSLLTIPRERRTIIKSLESQARSVSTSIAQVCGNAIVSEDYSFIVEHNIQVLQGNPDIFYIGVVRHDGFSLINTTIHWEQREQPIKEWGTGIENNVNWRIMNSSLVNKEVFHYGFPLEFSGLKWGMLYIGLSTENLNREIKTTYINMLFLSFLCFIIGLAVAYYFAKKLTTPILSLREATSLIAQGNLSSRVEIATGDEIEDLAISFNKMTDKLQKTTVSKNYMDNVFRNMNDSLIVATPDEKIQTVNKATLELLGYTADELYNKPLNLIIPGETLYSNEMNLLESIRKSSISNSEIIYLKKNGIQTPVLFSGSLMYDEDQRIQGIICVAADITERKKAEEELVKYRDHLETLVSERTTELTNANKLLQQEIKERKQTEEALRVSEERYRQLADSLPQTVFEADPKGKITYLNAFGFESFEYNSNDFSKGISIYNMITLESHTMVSKNMDIVLSGKKIDDVECAAQRKDGSAFPIIVQATPIIKKEKVMGLRGIFIDLTHRQQLEEERSKAQKLESIGILAGGIAHDFNNILAVIMGNVTLVKNSIDTTDKNFERLLHAEKASKRASDLTNQLLTFSKGGTPIKTPVPILDLINDSVSFSLSGSDIKCEFSTADDLWIVNVDPGQINQVLNNLIINADQAMPDGGLIKISAENVVITDKNNENLKKSKYVKISIEDHGTGISEEHLSKIFDPYFSTKPTGSGLGLTTSYSIIKKHEGDIVVKSELGVGTTFSIYLPAYDGPLLKPIKKETSSIQTVHYRILVMDDEKMLRETLTDILEELGCEVEGVRDGAEAIEIYKKAKESDNPFDLIIMDLTIPGGMGGKETILKLIAIDPDVKAIVSSGYSNDRVLSEFKKHGFRGMISKPFVVDTVSEIVTKTLKSPY